MAAREKRLKERADDIATETKAMTTGSYTDAVVVRAKNFGEHAPTAPGFATTLIGMFLLGNWSIRSGVMDNTGAQHDGFQFAREEES